MGSLDHSAAEKIKKLHGVGWSISEISTLTGLDRSELDRLVRAGRNDEASGGVRLGGKES